MKYISFTYNTYIFDILEAIHIVNVSRVNGSFTKYVINPFGEFCVIDAEEGADTLAALYNHVMIPISENTYSQLERDCFCFPSQEETKRLRDVYIQRRNRTGW
jgi:hypothetical protein